MASTPSRGPQAPKKEYLNRLFLPFCFQEVNQLSGIIYYQSDTVSLLIKCLYEDKQVIYDLVCSSIIYLY